MIRSSLHPGRYKAMPSTRTNSTPKRPRRLAAKKTACKLLSPAAKPKVFIASSWAALPLAQKLKNKLDELEPRVADVILWRDAFPVGSIILDSLREKAAEVDFAVVLFTAEDVVKDANSVEMRAPRDNCVFELGLFMGALG